MSDLYQSFTNQENWNCQEYHRLFLFVLHPITTSQLRYNHLINASKEIFFKLVTI